LLAAHHFDDAFAADGGATIIAVIEGFRVLLSQKELFQILNIRQVLQAAAGALANLKVFKIN
jgi:hypothetical protein